MYPGTIVEYVDQSFIEPITIETVANRPLLFALFTSDKGPESFQRVYGKDFFNLYGDNISFEKHGQPLLQAAMSINAGAELFCKRVVASDSTLAARSIIAKIRTPLESGTDDITKPTITHYAYYPGSVNPTDAETLSESTKNYCNELFRIKGQTEDVYKATPGTQLYTEKTCTTAVASAVPDICDAEGKLLVDKVVHLGTSGATEGAWYFTVSSTNYFVRENNENGQVALEDISNEHWFVLMSITDNGRGTSTKSYDVIENSRLSKNVSFAVYDIEVHEGINVIETIHFSIDPSAISGTTSMSLNEQARKAIQFDAYQDTDQYDKMMQLLMSSTGKTRAEIVAEDFVFGKTAAGQTALSWMGYAATGEHIIKTDANSDTCININDYTNLAFIGGSNGSFGTRPINSPAYSSAMAAIFTIDSATNVEAYPEIYDLDQHKIMAIIDANYPVAVKRAIEDLAVFREDFVYFRDMGIGLKNVASIQAANYNNLRSRYCATYSNSYDIYDPITRKQISVTVCYDLARLFVGHFINGRARPFCGIKYGITIPLDNMVPGTLNFSPKRTPALDQRQVFDDERINSTKPNNSVVYVPNPDVTDQLKKFKQLSDEGVITQEEFEAKNK